MSILRSTAPHIRTHQARWLWECRSGIPIESAWTGTPAADETDALMAAILDAWMTLPDSVIHP